ncbi:terminase [Thalassotalea loyana]|uniref:Terminase n=1 Tax=Thalassotalea loyana TaxID=280483 RepID=A0ABQ6HDW7_9GAMM|nr:terminase small subunit [Thalassotalea loyana]GLX85081.1 terminase [Thalassotalea loyana]
MAKLNNQQAAFVIHYAAGENGTQSAVLAGYSEKTAAQTASRLLRNVKITDAIKTERSERLKRLSIDKDYVLLRMVEIDQLDVLDIVFDDGSVKPLSEWPRPWRQFISQFEVSELFEGHGDERAQIGFLKKLKWPDKVKNLEMIGKHIDVGAFSERKEVKTTLEGNISVDRREMSDDELSQRIAELEKKVKKAS